MRSNGGLLPRQALHHELKLQLLFFLLKPHLLSGLSCFQKVNSTASSRMLHFNQRRTAVLLDPGNLLDFEFATSLDLLWLFLLLGLKLVQNFVRTYLFLR